MNIFFNNDNSNFINNYWLYSFLSHFKYGNPFLRIILRYCHVFYGKTLVSASTFFMCMSALCFVVPRSHVGLVTWYQALSAHTDRARVDQFFLSVIHFLRAHEPTDRHVWGKHQAMECALNAMHSY